MQNWPKGGACEPIITTIVPFVRRALTEDLVFHDVVHQVGLAILLSAKERHNQWSSIHQKLKIPHSTLYGKRKAIIQNRLARSAEPAPIFCPIASVNPLHERLLERATALVLKALSDDVPFQKVIGDFERLMLECAHLRHRSWRAVQHHLRIPRSTLYAKRREYSLGYD